MNRIKYALTVIVVLIGGAVIYLADDVSSGIVKGIEVCINVVVPSLFTFSIIGIFIVNSKIFINNKIIDFIAFIMFGIKGEPGAVSLLSLVCGYPIGGALINELYTSGRINKRDGQRMLNYCINPGPAFIVGMVGMGIYNSYVIGLILLLSTVLATVVCGRIAIRKVRANPLCSQHINKASYTDVFLSSINKATVSMVKICGWVIIANALKAIIQQFQPLIPLTYLLEITSAVENAAGTCSIYTVAFLIGFGGFSVHLQAISAAGALKPKFSSLILWRTIHGLLSYGFCYLLFKLCPQTIKTSISTVKYSSTTNGGNVFTATIMILFILSTIIFINQKINSCRKT